MRVNHDIDLDLALSEGGYKPHCVVRHSTIRPYLDKWETK